MTRSASKFRYIGQTCAYCAKDGSSEAPDHIFARGFFPVEERDQLPQVPACRGCNQDKATLEHYLLTVLPFGGEAKAAQKMLSESVPRRLAQNLKLQRELAAGRSNVLLRQGNLTRPTIALPIDFERLLTLFKFITRGLVNHHWNMTVPISHVARAGMFTSQGEAFAKNLFQQKAAASVQGKIGADTILYEGVQAHDDPFFTIWRYRIYGGLILAGDPKTSEAASDIWTTTSRPELPSLFDF